jgi:hypothetical protein
VISKAHGRCKNGNKFLPENMKERDLLEDLDVNEEI